MQALQACRQAIARRTALQHVEAVAAPHLRQAAWRCRHRCCPPPEAGRRHRHSQPERAAPATTGRGKASRKQQDSDAQPESTGIGGMPVEPKRVRPLGPGLPNLQQVGGRAGGHPNGTGLAMQPAPACMKSRGWMLHLSVL